MKTATVLIMIVLDLALFGFAIYYGHHEEYPKAIWFLLLSQFHFQNRSGDL